MWDAIGEWLGASGVKIAFIAAAAWLLERFAAGIVARVVRGAMNPDNYASQREERLREKTIAGLVSTIVRVGIIVITIMVILSEFKIDIGPLLAGAGILGFAIGFGAQSLIKDFIAGIYIVLENQYRVGDVVTLNGVSGQVKKISTRITVLRDLDGSVHYIPNGSINMATNMTMEYAKLNMNISVAYDSDLDKVKDVINATGRKLSGDGEWKDYITEAPYFARVSDFGERAVIVKIFGKTVAAKQWSVEGELRRRLLAAFTKNKIVIPLSPMSSAKPKK